jgi:nucleoside-diphosphate-sugar epimerase
MKRVLITGKNSYIGTSVENWLKKEPSKYYVDSVDMKDGLFREKDFSKYDVVFHVAGIAHIKETKVNEHLYYEVNRDLAYETAKKAKEEGVRQFVFLSSMSVYGIEFGIIDNSTLPKPNNAYGKSKLQAEELIKQLEDESFSIVTIRPPMVYGEGCKGNYTRLSGLAIKTPIFPNISNKRSMIFIDNLSQFVKQVIDNESSGLFFPQNAEYVATSDLVQLIASVHGKKVIMTKLFNPYLRILNISMVNKMFRDLVYEKSMSEYNFDYRVCNFKESILKTEVAKGSE